MGEDTTRHSKVSSYSGGYSSSKQEQCSRYLRKLQEEFIDRWNESVQSNVKVTDFERRNVIGTGAFGVVVLVKHIPTEKFYAMKMIEKEKVIKLKQLEHSYNEKKILCSLNFPFVVYMKYFLKDNVYLYFILPFVPGGEMFSHLRTLGKYDETSSQFYAAQMILALEYLHACGLVYRDLKPENILIERNGYLKLTDFGFCKLIRGRTWTLCGTPEYLAPEIILSKGYGVSVDWWSLGILIYEMCAGHPPFYASDPMRIYEKIVSGKYRCPPHFTSELKYLLSNLLQLDPSRRYGNLKDGVLDLKNDKWFYKMDWDSLLNCRIRAPFIPNLKGPGDTSNFEYYDDEKIKECSVCLYDEEFSEF